MPIAINGSGTVTGISVGGLPDGIVDSDTLASGAGGKLLQVVQGTKTSGTSAASSSYGDLGLSASITPQTNSKILCFISIHASITYTDNRGFGIKLLRDSSTVYEDPIDYAVHGSITSGDGRVRADWTPLDSSPGGNGSTSLTYKIQVKTHGGRSVSFNEGNTYSYLTLFEIGA